MAKKKPKTKIPPLDGRPQADARDRLFVILTAPTKKLVKAYGKKTVIAAMTAAGLAAVDAIETEIRDQDLIDTGQLIGSVYLAHAGIDKARIGFAGRRTDDGKYNASIALYLNNDYGIVDFSNYLEEAQDAWVMAFGGS